MLRMAVGWVCLLCTLAAFSAATVQPVQAAPVQSTPSPVGDLPALVNRLPVGNGGRPHGARCQIATTG
jgi:hypothetical protein